MFRRQLTLITDRLLRHALRRRLRTGLHRGFHPTQMALETTSACNAHCMMCPRRDLTRPSGVMSPELHRVIVTKVAAWCPRLRAISHAGMGEPLLDRMLEEKIDLEKRLFPQARVVVYTNASLLTEDRARSLIQAGLDELSVSLNANCPETYQAVVGLPYAEVLDNVLRYADVRAQLGARAELTVSLIPTHLHSEPEIAAFSEFWRGMADHVVVPPLISWGGHVGGTPLPSCWPCHYLWNVLMVDWNGVVKMCCEDFDTRFPLGDLTKQTPAGIFNSVRLNRQRADQVAGRFEWPEICRECVEAQGVAREFWKGSTFGWQ